MGRSPCCEKVGLKRGPWSKEEDDLLINYINKNGHPNWRALPKLAGLLRCGKSCRLRWTNYLKPDIKRGNFTPEEEDTIIKLHKVLGNRWSAIAARLPGRTDNEIKNIWHTRVKKKMNESLSVETPDIQEETMETSKSEENLDIHSNPGNSNLDIHLEPESSKDNSEISSPKINPESQQQPSSSVRSSSSISSSEYSCSNTTATSSESRDQIMVDNLLEVDDDFWSEVLWAPVDDSNNNVNNLDLSLLEEDYQLNSSLDDSWFWDDLLSRSNEFILELPEL